jgi:hypothetical protein
MKRRRGETPAERVKLMSKPAINLYHSEKEYNQRAAEGDQPAFGRQLHPEKCGDESVISITDGWGPKRRKPWAKNVYASDLSRGARYVWSNLCEHRNSQHLAFPGIGCIAEELQLSHRAVQRAIKELIEKGWLCTPKGNGGGAPGSYTVYHLHPDGRPCTVAVSMHQQQLQGHVPPDQQRVTDCHPSFPFQDEARVTKSTETGDNGDAAYKEGICKDEYVKSNSGGDDVLATRERGDQAKDNQIKTQKLSDEDWDAVRLLIERSGKSIEYVRISEREAITIKGSLPDKRDGSGRWTLREMAFLITGDRFKSATPEQYIGRLVNFAKNINGEAIRNGEEVPRPECMRCFDEGTVREGPDRIPRFCTCDVGREEKKDQPYIDKNICTCCYGTKVKKSGEGPCPGCYGTGFFDCKRAWNDKLPSLAVNETLVSLLRERLKDPAFVRFYSELIDRIGQIVAANNPKGAFITPKWVLEGDNWARILNGEFKWLLIPKECVPSNQSAAGTDTSSAPQIASPAPSEPAKSSIPEEALLWNERVPSRPWKVWTNALQSALRDKLRDPNFVAHYNELLDKVEQIGKAGHPKSDFFSIEWVLKDDNWGKILNGGCNWLLSTTDEKTKSGKNETAKERARRLFASELGLADGEDDRKL